MSEKYFGLVKVRIEEVIYVDDKRNTSFSRFGIKAVQYRCRIIGGTYNGSYLDGVINSVDLGGQYNYDETILSGVEEQPLQNASGDAPPSLSNGDFALVLGMYGSLENSIIIRGFPHPQNKKLGKKKEDGKQKILEFNGVEIRVDNKSNLRIQQRGRKDPKGRTLNTQAVGSELLIYENGDIELNGYGTDADKVKTESSEDLRIKMTKETKKIEISAQQNKIVADDKGVSITDKNQNVITMEAGKVTIKTSGEIYEDCSTAKIGNNASFHATLAENVISLYDQHNHQAPQAPAGIIPTMPPITPMASYAGTALDPTALKIFLKGNS